MTRPATRDPEATRTAIIKAAYGLFVEKGFADTSVSEIAKAAGVTQSLIHHHFGSKQELWRQVSQSCMQELAQHQEEHLRRVRELPGAEGVRVLMRDSFAFMRKRPDLMRLFLWVNLERALIPLPDCDDLRMAQQMRDHFVYLQKAGVLRSDLRPEYIMQMQHGLLMQWIQARQVMTAWMHHGTVDPALATAEVLERTDEEYLDAAVKVFLDGVTPRP